MIGVLKLLVFLAVAAVAAALALRRETTPKTGTQIKVRPKGAVAGALLVLVMPFLLPAIGTVPAGHRGIVLRFGAVTGTVSGEGIYMVVPVVNSVELMSVQVIAYEADAPSASKDLQEVKTKVTVNYYLDPLKVARIYQTLRQDYEVRIIRPAVQEGVKASTALFDAEKLIGERPRVKEAIEKHLRNRLAEHGIMVDAVAITDFEFSPEFTKAIEGKVKAVQDALRARNELERVKMEAQQEITRAQAEAQALRLKREQVTRELIELKRVEALMKALEKWDGHLPSVLTGNGPVPILEVFQQGAKNKSAE